MTIHGNSSFEMRLNVHGDSAHSICIYAFLRKTYLVIWWKFWIRRSDIRLDIGSRHPYKYVLQFVSTWCTLISSFWNFGNSYTAASRVPATARAKKLWWGSGAPSSPGLTRIVWAQRTIHYTWSNLRQLKAQTLLGLNESNVTCLPCSRNPETLEPKTKAPSKNHHLIW